MKIVHCFFTMNTGGSQILAIDMLNVLCLSNEVSLIVVNDQWNETLLQRLHKRVTLYRINRKAGGRNPVPILHLNYLLAKLKPDVIHCHERDLIKIIKYQRAKILYTIHDVGIPTATFLKFDTLVAISDSVAQDVYRRSGLQPVVIPNGIPFTHFRQRTDYSFQPESGLRLVQVSRLMHEKKGQDVLIRAIAALLIDRPDFVVTVDIIGSGESAAYLVDLARSLHVDQHIRFLGEQTRTWLHQQLADYHALVQPSRYEGFGLTVVEGFAAGLPVIASNIEGPAEILRNLPAGFLFGSEDSAACAGAIQSLRLAYERQQISGAIQQTRSQIEAQFSIETMVDRYLSVYQRLAYSRVLDTPRPRLNQSYQAS